MRIKIHDNSFPNDARSDTSILTSRIFIAVIINIITFTSILVIRHHRIRLHPFPQNAFFSICYEGSGRRKQKPDRSTFWNASNYFGSLV